MNNLTRLTKEELLNRAKTLVEQDRKISLQLIEVLRECERRMLFAELGYGSLWQFAVEHLGLSEGSAQLRISAMRLARENPAAKESLESGKLSLSNASQLQSFFQAEKKQGKTYNHESKKEIIDSVTGLSKKECERHLFTLAPETIPQEKARIVSESKTELKVVLDNEVLTKLQRLKELMAHRFPRATYGELISYLADQTLATLENTKAGLPVRKQPELSPLPDEVKQLENSGTIVLPVQDSEHTNTGVASCVLAKTSQMPRSSLLSSLKTPRIYISVKDRRSIWRRSGNQCEFVAKDGKRCTSQYQLEIDHIVPLSQGGKNSASNYRCVCRTHNIFAAQQKLGRGLMQKYVYSLN